MDSQHRHELKDNDLANLLAGAKDVWNDKDWWTRYGNWILLVLLLISGGFFLKSWMDRSAASAHEQVWTDLGLASSPESYDAIANNYQDKTIKALALLRGGDLLEQRAAAGQQIISTMRPGATTQPDKVTTDPQADASSAISRYQEVLDMTGVDPLIRYNAMLGMASAYEDQHAWDKAREVYQKLAQTAAKDDAVIAQRAKNRLEILSRLDEPVRFAAEPPAAKETSSATSDANDASLSNLVSVPLRAAANPPAPKPAAAAVKETDAKSAPAATGPAKP
jgi:hypothetical protein